MNFCNLRLYNARYVLDTERDAPTDGTVLLANEAASIRRHQWQEVVNRREKVIKYTLFSFFFFSFGSDINKKACLFAGAFNVQLDEAALLKEFSAQRRGIERQVADDNGNIDAVEIWSGETVNLLRRVIGKESLQKAATVSRSRFDLHESHNWFMLTAHGRLIRKFDYEAQRMAKDIGLIEVGARFAPRSVVLVLLETKSD